MRRTYALIASLLTTLHEAPRGEAPSGILYAGFMAQGLDLGAYQALLACLTNAPKPLATVSGAHMVTLTKAGHDLAAEIESALGGRAMVRAEVAVDLGTTRPT